MAAPVSHPVHQSCRRGIWSPDAKPGARQPCVILAGWAASRSCERALYIEHSNPIALELFAYRLCRL